MQAKGFPYTLTDLLGDEELVRTCLEGRFVTLRLRSDMYHRFHAPYDCRVALPCDAGLRPGALIRMGQPLLTLPGGGP